MLTKKWLVAGVFTLLSLSLAMAAPPAVHPATGEPLVITCLKGTPDVIDGDLSDWSLDTMTPAVLDTTAQINSGQANWTGPADCSGKFYLLWDDTKIYIAAVVKDDKLSMTKTGGNIWNADCLEVFFSTTNAVTGHAEHYQFGFNADGQKWNWESMGGAAGVDPDYLKVASTRTADGYICEVSIEYGRLSSLNFAPGNTLGFHAVIDDTEATDREIQMTWTGREAHDQSLGFGNIILSSEPAVAKELSRGPSPANRAVDVPVDTILSWNPGQFAASHDVYLGMVFDDVNDATRDNPLGVLVGRGLTAAEFDPAGLAYGKTYYWRVDEVNAPPDSTIYKGIVWSFTAEPYTYTMPSVTVTASSASTAQGMTPVKTVDGSGLNADGQHSSVDIYNGTDEFRFAYKKLTGDGSITVRVDKVETLAAWTKAGVMIRESLAPLAMQVHMISAAQQSLVEWMYRSMANTTTTTQFNTTANANPLPVWLRITRAGNVFTGECSANGTTWTKIAASDGTPSSITIAMPASVYVGMVVCSLVADNLAVADFSQIKTSGNVTGQWQVTDVGVAQPANQPGQLYVVIQDSANRTVVVKHPDGANAVLADQWTQWKIPLSQLSSVNLKAVKKITIGVGDQAGSAPGGAGMLFIDDIGYGHTLSSQ